MSAIPVGASPASHALLDTRLAERRRAPPRRARRVPTQPTSVDLGSEPRGGDRLVRPFAAGHAREPRAGHGLARAWQPLRLHDEVEVDRADDGETWSPAQREPRLPAMTVAHWDEVELASPREGRDGCVLAGARRRCRNAGRRRQPRPRRAGQALDTAPLARRVGGALLRPRRLRARLAERRGARGAAARLRHPARRRDGPHVRRRARRPRVPRLRHAAPDGVRLAAAFPGCPARRALGRGPRRQPVGRRGDGRPLSSTASLRPRPANIVNVDEVELEQGGRSRPRRSPRRSARSSPACTGSRYAPAAAAAFRIATPPRKKSS